MRILPKLEETLYHTGILIFSLCIVFVVLTFRMSGFAPEVYDSVLLYSILPIAISSFVGSMIMRDYQNASRFKFVTGFIIGIIVPVIIFSVQYYTFIQNQYNQCLKYPAFAFCENVLSKSERKNVWNKNMKENCSTLNREDYYVYRCPNEITVDVPDEYRDKWSSDDREANALFKSLDPIDTVIKNCFEENSPINNIISSEWMCDATIGSFYGKWPTIPIGWKLVSFSSSLKDKSYRFELQKYDMDILCDQTSQYCKRNW